MNDIIQKLIGEVKLDEATAKKAVDVVLGFVKDKLPAPIAAQVENALNGADLGDLTEKAGSLLGGFLKKD